MNNDSKLKRYVAIEATSIKEAVIDEPSKAISKASTPRQNLARKNTSQSITAATFSSLEDGLV